MFIKIKIGMLDYGDLFIKAMPVLREKLPENNTEPSFLSALMKLTEEELRIVLAHSSQEAMHEELARFIEQNAEQMQKILEKLLGEHDVWAKVSGISLDREGFLQAYLDDIDYEELLFSYMPKVLDKLNESEEESSVRDVLTRVVKMSPPLMHRLMQKIPESVKSGYLARMIEFNRESILSWITEWLGEQDIRIRLDDMMADSE